MFIQTEETPNPNAIKFFPGVEVSDNPIHFASIEDVKNSNLAKKLFQLEHVQHVFFGSDFITITKKESSYWENLKPEILVIIMDHFVAGFSAFDDSGIVNNNDNYDLENLSEIEKQIVEIIETRVRPSVAMDGGDIIYKGFKDGVVKLELRGSCSGCPSSMVTLKNGVESMLQYYVPEVVAVEAAEEE